MHLTITSRVINNIQLQEKPFEIRDTQLKGLLLRVQPSGVMSYYLEYKRGKRVKLGRADAITPHQAREIAKAQLAEVYQGEDLSDKRRLAKTKTYKEFVEQDYRPWAISNLRTGEATAHRLLVNFPELHTIKLHEISQWAMEKWKLKRQKTGVKASTINRELADIKACLTRAVQWEFIENHPIEHFKLCKVDKSPKVRFLSGGEEIRLWQAIDDREARIREDRRRANEWRIARNYTLYDDLSQYKYADYLKPVVILALFTGLRRGELFGLKWEDIDFIQQVLTVTAENAKAGKTRHLPLHTEVVEALRGWQLQSNSTTGYLFEGKNGKAIHDVRKSWAGVLKVARIESFRWHDLRHTFASNLVMNGVDLNTVRELLGHSDYKMTLRYAHLAPEHKALAINKLMKATS
jgi:integrase